MGQLRTPANFSVLIALGFPILLQGIYTHRFINSIN